jgi:cell division initiation protein
MIDLTPLEVRKKKGDFKRAMRGYDPVLVDDFLDLVADRLEELVRENLTLADRVARQEAMVTDYRDRERALTEALVSAQEMREEVRRQSVREAELAKQSAEQHAATLRSTVEEESRQLRAAAQQEVAQLRATVQHEREREEDALRTLRARQQELLTSYRALLERELAELSVLARTLGISGTGRGAGPDDPGSTAPRAPAAPRRDPPGGASRGGGQPAAPAAAPARKAAEQKQSAGTAAKPEQRPTGSAAAASEPPSPRTAAPPAAPAAGLPLMELSAGPPAVFDEFTGDALLESDIEDESMFALGGGADGADLDLEPFEPEPFEPEPYQPEPFGDESRVVAAEFEAEQRTLNAASHDESDTTDVATRDEERLYDALAADPDDDGVPGPIGLGTTESLPWDETWNAAPDDDDGIDIETIDLDAAVEEDEDADTAALLRNAAAAGYRLDDDDLTGELLLDEAVPEDTDAPEDDGWLPTLLEDDK